MDVLRYGKGITQKNSGLKSRWPDSGPPDRSIPDDGSQLVEPQRQHSESSNDGETGITTIAIRFIDESIPAARHLARISTKAAGSTDMTQINRILTAKEKALHRRRRALEWADCTGKKCIIALTIWAGQKRRMNTLGISGVHNSVTFKKREWPDLSHREYRIAQGFDAAAALLTMAGSNRISDGTTFFW